MLARVFECLLQKSGSPVPLSPAGPINRRRRSVLRGRASSGFVECSSTQGWPARGRRGLWLVPCLLVCGRPTPSTATTNRTPPSWTPVPPLRHWPLLGSCPAETTVAWTRCCGSGRGRSGGWGRRKQIMPRPSSPMPPSSPRLARIHAPATCPSSRALPWLTCWP